jgi:toxin YoeB
LFPKEQKKICYKFKDRVIKPSANKIDRIISELYEHPETGTGKPERLKFDLSGYWSRRINKKDRLIYLIEDQIIIVTVISALGHYSDK